MERKDTDVIEVKTKKSNDAHTSTFITWCNDTHCFVHAPNFELGAVTYEKIRTIFEKLASGKNIEVSELEIQYKELVEIFETELKIKVAQAKNYIKECNSKGIIYKTTEDRNAPYKLKIEFGSAY
jgi:hypothetical protein